MQRHIPQLLAFCAIAVLASVPRGNAQTLQMFEIDPDAAREQDRAYQQIKADAQRQYANCLAANKRIYLENRSNPACTLLGKCIPTFPCQKPAF